MMLTLTLMMSASLSSLLILAEMLVQDWDSWRLVEVVVEEKGHPAMDNAVSRRLLQQISRPGRFAQV